MELDEPSIEFKPVSDPRPTMPEPPPVRLVAVEDMRATVPAGLEVQMDEFYSTLLHFDREPIVGGQLVYKAENCRLVFQVIETPENRPDMKPIGIDVPSLRLLEREFIDREIEFLKEKGIFAGQVTFLLRDPAGNWVQIGEMRTI
jgi:hypothetical protein